MSTGSLPGVKCGRGVLLTTHPLLLPRSWESRTIPLPYRACNGISLPLPFLPQIYYIRCLSSFFVLHYLKCLHGFLLYVLNLCRNAQKFLTCITKHKRWKGPEISRRMRFPDCKTIVKFRWKCYHPYAPVAFIPRKYSWAIVLPEGLCQ